MTKADLAEGCQLLLTMDKKQYPVTVCNSSASLKEALAEVQVNGKFSVHVHLLA